ncbi:E3 ubiquitin-protein ligase TRAIP isoform X2 [Monomorium pharaonis]|uniref:E3 ubiquitin-protein ligase TRAIP isoform X2 n=1 Tax=Monomorium pharaonis TaxID=307658 RepID=UPI001747232C|nr:E3 ubiquitin-protein ligase TRAIP isoform X2 [Monomorium pharaonis]
MNIVCVICSELLTPSDDVFHTPCGHIFHFPCLMQWLERSKTCPQCREKTTDGKIHRIYFNFSNSDSIVEDATSLQHRIDNLLFQLKLKDTNLNNLTDSNKQLETKTTGLRQEVRKLESEIKSKDSAIRALKEQTKFLQQQCLDADNYKRENKHLKENLQNLKNVQDLINISVDEVDDVIMMTSDSSKLVTYIAVLKKELSVMSKKSKEIRERYNSLNQNYSRISAKNKTLSEEHTKRKELEKQLMKCESEKIFLQTQLLEMKKDSRKCICNTFQISSEKHDSLKAEHETIESTATMNESFTKLEDRLKLKNNDSFVTIDSDNFENTPESIKSLDFFPIRNRIKRQKSSNNLQVPSILMKKSRFEQSTQKSARGSGMSFDGFGGHAKYDKFPNPVSSSHIKKVRDDLKKIKKPKLDTVASRMHSRNAH